jgi:hypothetical protein
MRKFLLFLILYSLLINNIYALQTESDHFIYYYEAPDTSIIDTIIFHLENNFDRITRDLQVTISSKIKVHIYPTLQAFHNAIGQPDAPGWLVGTAYTEIFVVSPLNPGPNHSYDEMVNSVIVHEFTHVCTYKINGNIPIWLAEGFALYEAGPYYSKASVVSAYNSNSKIPSLDDLSYNFDNFTKLGGYPFSLTIARFIVEDYGMGAMRTFIRFPNDYSVFGGLTKSQFQDKWFEYVNKYYLDFTSSPGTEESDNNLNDFKLEQNYPNPFNSFTKIKYLIPSVRNSLMKFVQMKVYDVLGNEIATLVNEEKPGGEYEISFDADNLSGGIYFYTLRAMPNQTKQPIKDNDGFFVQTNKMVILR